MKLKQQFAVPDYPAFPSLALFVLRLTAGVAFVLHGWPKIQNPFGWMPPESPIPGFFQGLAALAEFGGGIAWILGALTPIASLGLLITMSVAFSFHAFLRGDPFVSMSGGPSSELAAVYFCVALLLLATGPGRFSLDFLIFGERTRPGPT